MSPTLGFLKLTKEIVIFTFFLIRICWKQKYTPHHSIILFKSIYLGLPFNKLGATIHHSSFALRTSHLSSVSYSLLPGNFFTWQRPEEVQTLFCLTEQDTLSYHPRKYVSEWMQLNVIFSQMTTTEKAYKDLCTV